MNFKRVGIAFLWVLLFVSAGCIKEDRSDCPEAASYMLSFIYYGDGVTDIFDSKIDHVSVWLFDEDGLFVNKYMRSRAELNAFQGIPLNPGPGEYRVVCWGNLIGLSEVIEEGNEWEDYFLYSAPYLSGIPVTDFDSLYYGTHIITIPEKGEGKDTVFFRSSHINMEVYVEGLSTAVEIESRAVGDPQGWIIVRNVAVGYDFRMEVTDDTASMYPALMRSSNENILVALFNLFRFTDHTSIVIDIYNGEGQQVYSLGLSEFLAENNITIEGINEITVPVYIKFEGINVHVSVAGWGSEDVKPVI